MNCASLGRHALLDELASKRVRATAQRRAPVEVIQEADEHRDAVALVNRARERELGIDRATVCRTIELLKKFRLVDELDLIRRRSERHYYKVKSRREHIHLACFRCRRIEEFSSSRFECLERRNIKANRIQNRGKPTRCGRDLWRLGRARTAARRRN
ncbi:MAG TPA: transcriptional repressor [Bryobacteraceae bacterium]|nr:transcriptional repressor [Bryobacteraceae bacterium]